MPFLIESMARQTIVPQQWIIINDGSADATCIMADAAANDYPWIAPRHLERG